MVKKSPTKDTARQKEKQSLSTRFMLKFTRIKSVEKMFFVDHMKTMVHAGLSIIEALHILERETQNPRFKILVGEIRDRISKGGQLSEVLGDYPEVFPSIYVQMIQAGEVGGKLEEALGQVATQMKKTEALKASIRGAMIYPTVIVVVMFGVGLLMATMVLPQLVDIFRDFDSDLPFVQRMLIKITDIISKPLNLVIFFSTTGLFIWGYIYSLKRFPAFRHFVHKVNLKWPIFGDIIKKINLARFSITLSSLMKSTVPIIQAVGITANTCSNILYQKALHRVSEQIKTGAPLSQSLEVYATLFPPMVTEMVLVGEKSGEIDALLTELADYFNSEVDNIMKNFSTIIEPVIIVFIGVAVAVMAVAIIMPMYNLVQDF